jgi:MFS family permease
MRLLATIRLLSMFGASLVSLAAAMLVFRLTGSVLAVALVLVAATIPGVAVGLVAGVLVDRIDRKWTLVATLLVRGGLAAAIPIAVENGVAWLYAIVLLSSIAAQLFEPAWESAVSEVADDERGAEGAALSAGTLGATAVGFIAAGLLAATDRLDLAFLAGGLALVASAPAVLPLAIAPGRQAGDGTLTALAGNLGSGFQTVASTPILRAAFVAGLPVFVALGAWSVLLLPFTIRALGTSELGYSLQEAAASLGFVIGTLLVARFSDRLRDGAWMVLGTVGMAGAALAYAGLSLPADGQGQAPTVAAAVVLVAVFGLFNAPSSMARRLIIQRAARRELRGRVSAAFFVGRDAALVLGMLVAGLADLVDVRLVVVATGLLLLVSGAWVALSPGLGQPTREWRAAMRRLRDASAGPASTESRPATVEDIDRLIARIPALAALDGAHRLDLQRSARVVRAEGGWTVVRRGGEGDTAYFILHGRLVAGVPDRQGRHRSLSTMEAGDFFGEITALTGGRRTADVVADEMIELIQVPAATLRQLISIPPVRDLLLSKLTERLARTPTPDLPRVAGPDQRDMRDLASPHLPATAESLPRSYAR